MNFVRPILGAVLIAIALDTACWNKIIGLVVGLVLAAVLAVPSWLTAILVTMAAGALLICYTIIVIRSETFLS